MMPRRPRLLTKNRFCVALAPAKINLTLHVTGRNPDGFHDLDTLVVFAKFGDQIRISESDRPEPISMTLSGPFGDLLLDTESNLAFRAADEFQARYHQNGKEHAHLNIELEKNLPIASGIGGGSADAAAVLQSLSKVWEFDDDAVLEDVAGSLGADVPMCLTPYPKRVQGIGHRHRPLEIEFSLNLVLVNPLTAVSTAEVFSNLENPDNPALEMLNSEHLTDMDQFLLYLQRQRNDLQSTAIDINPDIIDVLETLDSLPDCQLSRMSGSGATCFGLFKTQALAERTAQELSKQRNGWWIKSCQTYSILDKRNAND